jgi:hypothetical protein
MTYITQDYRRRRHQSQSLDPQREREGKREERERGCTELKTEKRDASDERR